VCDSEHGECRRFPPTIVASLLPDNPGGRGVGELDYGALENATRFPVNYSGDWCGEWTPRHDDDDDGGDPNDGERNVVPIRSAA
jgi:hypothetical protein